MNLDTFNQYATEVSRTLGCDTEDIFTRTKKRHLVDARQILFYIANQNDMSIVYIQKFMKENGMYMEHSTIIHGINRITDMIPRNKQMKRSVECIAL